MIKDFITVIKDNTFTISLIGDLPNISLKKTYDGFSQISKIFSSISKFNLFMNTKKLYFTSEKIVFTFKNCKNGNILNGDFVPSSHTGRSPLAFKALLEQIFLLTKT